MKSYARLAARVFNTPLLATPEASSSVADVILAAMHGEPIRAFDDDRDGDRDPAGQLYDLDADGIATISVHGELVNRGSWMDAMSGLTSYKTIGAALDAAAKDHRVRGIVLDMDSPGGEAAGAMETAAKVRAVAGSKRVVAYVDSLAASAAYAIAAGASEIVATPSATVGSIGVVWMHLDRSQAMKERGVKPTLLHAGAYKVDGNAYGPLPDEARARIQSQIDGVYDLFTASVGRHRPKLGAEGARKTEAGVFLGEAAVAAGLADRVGGLETVKSSFPRKALWSLKMDPNEPVHTKAALDAAVAAARKEGETAQSAAVAQARADERARIAAILDGEAAKTRPALARKLALGSDMSPDAAADILGAAATETAPAPSRMSQAPVVDIRPGATQQSADPDHGWGDIVSKQNARLPAVARRA